MRVRLARAGDCALIPAIERSAAQRFAEAGMDDVAGGAIPEGEHWEPFCASSTLWVAVDDADTPFGFLAAGVQGSALFIYELAVQLDRQRQGAGRALVVAAEAKARTLKLRDVVLTTFCDVPWNAPYYRGLGYVVVEDAALPGPLQAVMEAERRRWPTPDRQRCPMAKRVAA